MKEGKDDEEQTPRCKFVKEMRQVEIDWLRAMDGFAETAEEFTHNNLIVEAGLKKNSTTGPEKKNRERNNPRPRTTPAAPRFTAIADHCCNHSRQKECVNDRSFDQHCCCQERKD